MKILVTGSGAGGSWQIRGEQLGRAIGAKVLPRALEVGGYDAAIVVKRPPADLIARLHAQRVRVVWDIVDAWPQPAGNDFSQAECMNWLRERVRAIRPAAIVAPTQAMAADCAEFGVPVLALPHHARPGLRPLTPRKLLTIGYEGGEQHLGRWGQWLGDWCARHGYEWRLNPPELADLDIVVALRDRTGYAPRHWKSNVKLANAQGAGVPIICAREAGYMETASGAERWADNEAELDGALQELEPVAQRAAASLELRKAAPALADVAAKYRAWLHEVAA